MVARLTWRQGFLADYGVDKYNLGTAFGHFGIAVEDVSATHLVVRLFTTVGKTPDILIDLLRVSTRIPLSF